MAARSQAHATLGRTIRRYRVDRAISQEQLADLSGLHRTYVGGVERGERNLGFANLLRLADALGVRPSELLEQVEAVGVTPSQLLDRAERPER